MNYYAARQRSSDGRWDYTCRRDATVWPVGYCSPWDRVELSYSAAVGGAQEGVPPLMRERRDRFHGAGHATADEACACYRQYLLDFETNLEHVVHKCFECEVCGALTDRMATIGHGRSFFLCDAHRTLEVVAERFGPVGEIWSSY